MRTFLFVSGAALALCCGAAPIWAQSADMLPAMQKTRPKRRPSPPRLSVLWWCKKIGVSEGLLRKSIRGRTLGCVRVGARTLITEEQMQAFISRNSTDVVSADPPSDF